MRSPTSAESSSIAADGRAEHALAPFDGQVRPRQQLDVRAVRGQRRPQLVRGVRDQLLLSLLRLVEGCEHRVEVGCEACQLVPAAHRDPPVEVTRRAHLAHRPGERTHRAQHRIRGQSSEQGRRERPAERQAEQQPADAGDRRVRLGQRAQRSAPARRSKTGSRIVYSRIATPADANVPEVRGRQPTRHRSVAAEQGHEPRQPSIRRGAEARDDLEEVVGRRPGRASSPPLRGGADLRDHLGEAGCRPCRTTRACSDAKLQRPFARCHFAATPSADWISETSIWSCSFERTST